VQVDPVKPTLKAPGTKRLKLKYDELLSNFVLKFSLRRYMKSAGFEVTEEADLVKSAAGAYTRRPVSST